MIPHCDEAHGKQGTMQLQLEITEIT
eukprot:COSAG02_NODE_18050_length_964_cov_1.147977_1_plen_25_part_10